MNDESNTIDDFQPPFVDVYPTRCHNKSGFGYVFYFDFDIMSILIANNKSSDSFNVNMLF